MTGQEACSDDEMLFVTRAALKAAAWRSLNFRGVREVDATLTWAHGAAWVVLVSHDGKWNATVVFLDGTLLSATFRLNHDEFSGMLARVGLAGETGSA